MKGLLRRLRGIIGTGVTWAAGWGALFGVTWAVLGSPVGVVLEGMVGGAFLGGVAGGSFAVILSIAEGRKTLRELSLRRVATWGLLGGMSLLLALSPLAAVRLLNAGIPLSAMFSFLLPLGISGVLGAGFATGSVALAKREERKEIGNRGGDLLPPGE